MSDHISHKLPIKRDPLFSLQTFTLKAKAAFYSETLVSIYSSARCYSSEDHDLNTHRSKAKAIPVTGHVSP
jgi:hypothetical protein